MALVQSRHRHYLFSNSLHFRRSLSTTEDATKDALRRLLRETAQPVAVVTSFYPFDGADAHSGDPPSKFHGATLSSFTSIALDPHPLVAFSLRIPSRMATSLKVLMRQPARTPSLVINLLSSAQADAAHHFSRADLYPEPFRITPHMLTADGLPVLTGVLGALSCNLVSCMPLHDLCDDADCSAEEVENGTVQGGLISELFLSRVVRVESTGTLTSGKNTLPLLYHHRRYATARPLEFIPNEN